MSTKTIENPAHLTVRQIRKKVREERRLREATTPKRKRRMGRPPKPNPAKEADVLTYYRDDWVAFSRDILRVRLDRDQRAIVRSVQCNPKTVVASCNARGKDFVAAVISLCFLYLSPRINEQGKWESAKVIETGPTERQVLAIEMTEIAEIHAQANAYLASQGHPGLGGEVTSSKIKLPRPNWFLEAFKAGDKRMEDWSGYHAPYLLVVFTEASAMEEWTEEAIDGILTGNSRVLYVYNPHYNSGVAYDASQPSSGFKAFELSALDSVNVRAHQMRFIKNKNLIPGQVDWNWVNDKIVHKKGWVTPITEAEVDPDFADFKWEGKWYRPQRRGRVRILGIPPLEASETLIPRRWIHAAFDRWRAGQNKKQFTHQACLYGVDVAGMGNNLNVIAPRYDNVITELLIPHFSPETIHMGLAGYVKNLLREAGDTANIDTIGEGGGVYSRLREMGVQGIVSAKFSEKGGKKTDVTGEHMFFNMRAYCYWALRDALDPQMGINLALPPDAELEEDLAILTYEPHSSGKLLLRPKKSEIKKILGRSTDKGDACALTYYTSGKASIAGGIDVSPTGAGVR